MLHASCPYVQRAEGLCVHNGKHKAHLCDERRQMCGGPPEQRRERVLERGEERPHKERHGDRGRQRERQRLQQRREARRAV